MEMLSEDEIKKFFGELNRIPSPIVIPIYSIKTNDEEYFKCSVDNKTTKLE